MSSPPLPKNKPPLPPPRPRLAKPAAPAPAASPDEPSKGLIIAGRYLVGELLARGGMGSVWRGVDQELDRAVAIKFMDPRIAENERLRERFRREAKAAARLRTPHVVEIYDQGVDGKLLYIVMELLDGEDLQAKLRREKRLDLEQAAHILAQCAKALSRAEVAGIVHRDLKPGNVFLARHDEGMSTVVKILDFGVAKMPRTTELSEATRVGTMLGSPQYMSPEQARSTEVDHRSDLWSMAAIVYRMVTGKLAFNGQTEVDVVVNVCTGPVPVPSKILPAIPPEIDAFFERAFERDLDARFQSAIDMSQAFADAVRAAGDVTLLTPLPHDPLGHSHTTEPRLTTQSSDASLPGSAAPTAASWANASADELALELRRPNRWPMALGAVAVLAAAGAIYALGGTASSEPSSIAPPESGAADLAATPRAPSAAEGSAAQEPADSAQTASSHDASATKQAPSAAPPGSAQARTPRPRTPRPAPAAPAGTASPDRPNWGY